MRRVRIYTVNLKDDFSRLVRGGRILLETKNSEQEQALLGTDKHSDVNYNEQEQVLHESQPAID